MHCECWITFVCARLESSENDMLFIACNIINTCSKAVCWVDGDAFFYFPINIHPLHLDGKNAATLVFLKINFTTLVTCLANFLCLKGLCLWHQIYEDGNYNFYRLKDGFS